MPPIRVIRGLGGNGGTFLSRVLAALEGVLLLSETNPASANLFAFDLNPVKQLGAHYHELELPPYPGNMAELGAPPLFGAFVRQLAEECATRGRHLIIRDYNYADYIGTPFIWRPSGESSLDVALPGVELRDLLLIRHPVSQYASLTSHAELRHVLGHDAFLAGYRLLLERHPAAWRIRYEDLFGAFDDMVAKIARYFELPVGTGWQERLPEIDWARAQPCRTRPARISTRRSAPPLAPRKITASSAASAATTPDRPRPLTQHRARAPGARPPQPERLKTSVCPPILGNRLRDSSPWARCAART
jgi:hypothetical protein